MLEIETNWYKRTMNKIRIRRVFFRCYLSSKSTRVLVKCVQKRTPSVNCCLNFTKLSNAAVVSMLFSFALFRQFSDTLESYTNESKFPFSFGIWATATNSISFNAKPTSATRSSHFSIAKCSRASDTTWNSWNRRFLCTKRYIAIANPTSN